MNGDNNQQPVPGSQDQGSWQYNPGVQQAPAQPQPMPVPSGQLQPQQIAQPAPAYVPGPSLQSQQIAEEPEVLEFSWTGSEFIAHEKNGLWYGKLTLIVVVIAALLFLLTRDTFATIIVPAFAILFAISASRKPRTVTYELTSHGLAVGNKFYPYADFRSFSMMTEGAVPSIVFDPLKRFMIAVSVYYEPSDEEAIIGVISKHLPFQQRDHDLLERFSQKIRF